MAARSKERPPASNGKGAAKHNLLNLDALVAEQIEPPEVVLHFEQVEELGRQFSIELPYAARTSLAAFDVYDARRLPAAGADDDNGDDQCGGRADCSTRAPGGRKRQAGFALWFRGLNPAGAQQAGGGGFKLHCCMLNKSDTLQELGQMSPAASSIHLDRILLSVDEEAREACQLAPDDMEASADLLADVHELIDPLVSHIRRNSYLAATRDASRAGSSGDLQQPVVESLGQQQQVILESPLNLGSMVSVCLLDKRHCELGPDTGLEARNGSHWSRMVASLAELHHRLGGAWRQVKSDKQRIELEKKIDCFLRRRQASARRIVNEAGKRRFRNQTSARKAARARKVSKEQMEQLIESTKDSLNHLIDAQLLLRNKIADSSQQQSSWLRDVDNELLLKNNFNLLKIWQNLEETKQIACFVCEPIKANLADLFWFNRQRPTKALELALRNSRSSLANNSPLFFVSPLACFDAFQVKRGLLQVSVGDFRYHTRRIEVQPALK